MFFKKKRIKQNIPNDLSIELNECKQRIEISRNKISFSLSPSDKELSQIKEEIMSQPKEPSLAETLIDFIKKNGEKDSTIYKRAQVDRRLFNKIINEQDKYPSSYTIIKLGLALYLNIDEMNLLLNRGKMSFSNNNEKDIAIKYCINHQIYDIDKVNDILFACNLSLI